MKSKADKILAQKIANRETELQRMYDINKRKSEELKALIANSQKELAKCEQNITRCIERAEKLGFDILND